MAARAMAAGTYRTVQGDSFDAAAFRLWGDEHLAHALMAANAAHADVLVFPAGVELTVPDVTPETRAAHLPPWYGSDGS